MPAWASDGRGTRPRFAIGVVGLVLPLALAACGTPAAATTPAPSQSPDAVVVTEVLDGDTLRVTDAGWEETVRLVGINAPERNECWADQATAALVTLVEGRVVRLERDVSDRDRYGRLLRYVRSDTGQDVGGSLVDEGHAIARSYPPDTARDAEYRERQAAAQANGRGLWGPTACGAGATSGVRPIGIDIHPDAAGDDSRNLNDEWVRFTNLGDAPLDLDGWMVRDESSSHRYRFVGLVLDLGASVTLYSGCGVDTDTERFWCVNGSAIWNNGGDTVFLQDPAGNIVAQLGYPAPARAPDVAPSVMP